MSHKASSSKVKPMKKGGMAKGYNHGGAMGSALGKGAMSDKDVRMAMGKKMKSGGSCS
jgi:hypothetical protein